MTDKEALEILTKTDRVGVNLIFANDEETTKYNQDSVEALTRAIKALEFKINYDNEQAKMLDDWSKEYGNET